MQRHVAKQARLWLSLVGAALITGNLQPAFAGDCLFHRIFGGSRDSCCSCTPSTTAESIQQPGTTAPPSGQAPTEPPSAAEPSLAPEQFAALGGRNLALADSNVGYIDSAIPRNEFRFRFDAAYDNNHPDRAEFFYAKCGCFPGAPGPKGPATRPIETNVDYQDFIPYLELAASDRCSAFVELPFRLINGEVIDNTGGMADMNVGFKAAFVACPDRYLTFQFKTYIPTGDADRGLGTDHVSLEPGLLVYQRLSDRCTFEGELRDWIPVDGTDFAGNVIRYGVGLSYDVYQSCNCRVAPVGELVGWTVLGGKELVSRDGVTGRVEDAEGETIVNLKLGVRFWWNEKNSLYVGYGRALTGQVWYEDIARIEYRINF